MTFRFADLLRADRAGGTVVSLDRSGSRTRRQWRNDVAACAAELGFARGQRLALYATNTYEFSVALFAMWSRGAVPWLPASNGPPTVDALRGRVDRFVGEFADGEPIAMCASAHADASLDLAAFAAAELVLFSSGSTGEPKPVTKAVRQLEAEVGALEQVWGAQLARATILATVSHQHIYGLLFKLLWPLCVGRSYWAGLVAEPTRINRLTRAHAPCAWVSSPAFLKRTPARAFDAVKAVRPVAVFSSGGPLDPESARAVAAAFGAAPIEVYGSTETGGIGWRQQGGDDAWHALPGVEVRIDADDVLLARSPHLPDAAWHRTGDVGERIDAGRFRLKGRADRIVKIEEKRLSLTAVEDALRRKPGVIDAACVLLRGRREVIGAVLALDRAGYRRVHAKGRAAYVRELRRALRADVETLAIPRRYRFVDALPTNDRGKAQQTELAALFDAAPGDRHPRPRITRIDDRTIELAFSVAADSWVFKGHFPGAPVLPGAIQVLWAIRYGKMHLGLADDWTGLEAVKFSAMIRPNVATVLRLTRSETGTKLAFEYRVDGRVMSSGRLVRG